MSVPWREDGPMGAGTSPHRGGTTTTRRRTIAGSTVMVFLLASATVVAQSTTGRLIGTVADDGGNELAGVTVTIASEALIGGPKTRVTDRCGEFNFVGIAPGVYTVAAEHPGFIPQQRARVKVSLGHATSLHIEMPAGTFSGAIEVVDETPVVDPIQISAGQVFDKAYLQDSAIGSVNRNYLVVVNQAAGVAGGGSWHGVPQPRVFGSTVGENAYFIDGVDTTDPTMATATVSVNFDAIGEIQLLTGGFEAQYGRATGGIINLVTRSGGNRFSGTVDARYRDSSFQEGGDHFDTSELDTSRLQHSLTLGGPILRDKMWFFTAYENAGDQFTPIGSPSTREGRWQSALAKITWQVGRSWRLTGTYSSQPTNVDNFNASRWRAPEATAFTRNDSQVASAELSSVLSDSLLWNTTVSMYRFDTEEYPQSGDLQTIGHYNVDTDLFTHNFGEQQYWSSRRRAATADLTWFVEDLAGSHEFKGGVAYSDIALPDDGLCSTGTPDGELCAPNVPGFFFNDVEAGTALPFEMVEHYGFTEAEYSGAVATAFAQDAWRITRDLTLKIGLRYDGVSYDDNEGTQIVDMGMLQPRLGVAWDLTGDAKTLVRGSWGRFMHPNGLTLPSWVTTLDRQWSYWYSCSVAVPAFLDTPINSADACSAVAGFLGVPYRIDNEGWDPYGWILPPGNTFGSEHSRIDSDLRTTYADEMILAFERAVGIRSSIELTYVDKKTRDIFDDTCNGNTPKPTPGAQCDFFIFANIPELRRDYQALIARYETRGRDWLTLMASYTYSTSNGSVEYTQNQGLIVDHYPWNFNNIYGHLSDHRTHRLKLNGFFTLRGDWTIAFDGFWSSPFTWAPFETREDNPEIPDGFHLLEPRGNRDAFSNFQLDLQVSKGFGVGPVRMVLIGSVYNAFSDEQPTAVCGHISGCGDIEMGDPTDWQTPRRYELGFRVEF